MHSPVRVLIGVFGVFACALAVTVSSRAEEPHPGQVAYDRVCKVCHGPEGKGNAGPALVPMTFDDEELLAKVREGGGEMPPIAESRLSDDEVKQIGAYLRSLEPAE